MNPLFKPETRHPSVLMRRLDQIRMPESDRTIAKSHLHQAEQAVDILFEAMRVLRSRLYEYHRAKLHRERAEHRKSLIGSGDRSERIRTYNFPQNRMTDHRINLTLYKLDAVISGKIDDLIRALKDFDKQQRLAGGR